MRRALQEQDCCLAYGVSRGSLRITRLKTFAPVTTDNRAYVPIIIPSVFEDVAPREFRGALLELESHSRKLSTLVRDSQSSTKPEITILRDETQDPVFFARKLVPHRYRQTLFLRVSNCVIVHDKALAFDGGSPLTVAKRRRFLVQMAYEDLGAFAVDLMLVMNICRPGVLNSFAGYVFQNDIFVDQTSAMRSNLQFAAKQAQVRRWPRLRKIPLAKAWTWLTRQDTMQSWFSETPLGRAICAFTYFFGDHHWGSENLLELFWSLVGLEAVYCRGNYEIANQLIEKTQLVLGKQRDFKNAVKKMYHYRSRLVHGDIDFPGQFNQDADDSFFDESADYARTAAAILVATLQTMCTRDLDELQFTYGLKRRCKIAKRM